MPIHNVSRVFQRASLMRPFSLFVICFALVSGNPAIAGPESTRVATASGSARVQAVLATAAPLGARDPGATTRLAFVLPLRNQSQLDDLIHHLYDPADPLYGHYLTPQRFASQFGPTESDYAAVKQYAQSLGLTIDSESPARDLLVASGPSSVVERSFNVRLDRFRLANGRTVYANDTAPAIPEAIAAKLIGIAGLDDVAQFHPASKMTLGGLSAVDRATLNALAPRSLAAGTGPAGGLGPTDLRTAYQVSSPDGTGMSAALLEEDGYSPSDVNQYFKTFGITPPTLNNILLDGFNGVAGANQDEVVLDIDMLAAMAPGIQTIYVYEGSGTAEGFLNIVNKIATDNLAPVVSISWGIAEDFLPAAAAASENQAFGQMAAQGQTVCVASGDSGAYGDAPETNTSPTVVAVDPASQPFVVAVGGTTLSTAGPGGSYAGEVVWQGTLANAATNGGGSGGGPSVIWPKPSYQIGDASLGETPVGESATMRDVPDVALDSDPASGEDIFLGGNWITVGGTSAAAPLWASFLLLVDEVREGQNAPPIGFPNIDLYRLGRSQSLSPTVFHDITVGNNLVFNAKVGYDDATGWGSFIGDSMLQQLSPNRGLLSGTVTDTGNNPVVGATVTVTGANGDTVTATTLADGSYTITNAPVGVSLTATASKSDFVSQTVSGLVLNSSTTTVQNFTLAQAHIFQPGLQMISAPYEYSGLGTFDTIFGLTHQATDPRLFIWQSFEDAYVSTPSAPADTLHLGEAYWVRLSHAMPLPVLGTPAPETFRLVLNAGWNQISDPYLSQVPLSSVEVDSLTPGTPISITSSTQVRLPLFVYDGGINNYVALTAGGSLQPWTGYWLFANQNCVLVITQP